VSRIALPATKSALLRLRSDLEFLEAGRELLDQKREFLSAALQSFDRDAAALREGLEAELAQAYEGLAEAHAALGDDGLRRLALAAAPVRAPGVRERSLMGVAVPLVQRQAEGERDRAEEPALAAAPGEAGAAAAGVARRLRRLAEPLAELGALESCCLRLARELVRTRRKLNALEVVHIPNHRETIRFIADRLEEREREALFQLKRVKALAGGRP
jgi:V/A-type H+-transporting ATPase subunit D